MDAKQKLEEWKLAHRVGDYALNELRKILVELDNEETWLIDERRYRD